MSTQDSTTAGAAHTTRRRQRQQLEVLSLVVLGSEARASALGREHLFEFPDDELVRLALELLSRPAARPG